MFWKKKKPDDYDEPRQRFDWAEDYDYAIDNQPRRGFIPMRWQIAAYSFIVTLGSSIYTNPAMWAHIDRIKHPYALYLKGGLIGVIDLTLFFLVLWALNGRSFRHRTYSFFAAAALTTAMIIHAGAVNKLEAKHGENQESIKSAADGLKEIAAGQAEGAARAQADAAIEANARGQRKLAKRLSNQAGKAGSEATADLSDKFLKKAENTKDETFLPEWYLNGAMYWALMVFAGMLGLIGVKLGEQPDRNAQREQYNQSPQIYRAPGPPGKP